MILALLGYLGYQSEQYLFDGRDSKDTCFAYEEKSKALFLIFCIVLNIYLFERGRLSCRFPAVHGAQRGVDLMTLGL